MMVVDLFCGLKGFSQAFEERGHEVITVDIEKRFNPTICADVTSLGPDDFKVGGGGKINIVVASPPCNCFSIASMGTHWREDYRPASAEVIKAISLIYYTIWLIKAINPRYWVLENPMGMLRKILGKPVATVTLCQYGDKRMKPTDLWGDLPPFPIRKCKNGDTCHEEAPRGSKTGTQGLNTAEERAMLPFGLSEAICLAVEGAIPKETLLRYL